MNKRILWLGFALVIIAALAVGCSSEEPSVTPSPEAPTPTVAAPTPTTAATTPAPTPSATESMPSNSYLPEIPRISVQEIKTKLDAGANIVIVDGRPAPEYEVSHILGSISMPVLDFLEMDAPYAELDPYDEIMLYCT